MILIPRGTAPNEKHSHLPAKILPLCVQVYLNTAPEYESYGRNLFGAGAN
jgi:hypothetical protein